MKKIKVGIIGIVIGFLLAFTINMVGASISSNGVLYNSKTLNTVLDDLYSKLTYKKYENGTAIYFNPETNSICSSSSAVSTTGTKTGCMKWYTFNDTEDSSTVNMILDHNTTAKVQYNSTGSNTAKREIVLALAEDTATWNTSLNARLITADEVAKITGNTSFSGWFYLDSNSKTQTAKSKGASKYAWLYDYTSGCTSYGCNIEDNNTYTLYGGTSTGKTYAYWTSTPVFGSTNVVWRVVRCGYLTADDVDSGDYGLRPVITISKSIIS